MVETDVEKMLCALRTGAQLPKLQAPGKPLPLQGHFSTVLQTALAKLNAGDPEASVHFAHHTEEFATLYDGYPKSEVHLLVMPRQRIQGPRDLTTDHIPLLQRLAAYTSWVLEGLSAQRPKLTWRHGIHAAPSLHQLHVHVISQDFKSPCMKNKKHYNSFQPPFLIDLGAVVSALQNGAGLGSLGIGSHAPEEWLKRDLRCTACGMDFGNKFAQLKRHIEECRVTLASAPLPLDVLQARRGTVHAETLTPNLVAVSASSGLVATHGQGELSKGSHVSSQDPCKRSAESSSVLDPQIKRTCVDVVEIEDSD